MLVHLGFSSSATKDIYQRQGGDFINKSENFDKDGVVLLICSVRKTGGSRNGEMVGF